jgi:hypothetical protein
MPDLNLVDRVVFTSSLIPKSTLPLDRALLPSTSMITVMPMVTPTLMQRMLVRPRRVTRTLTEKGSMITITALVVMTTVTHTAVTATLMDR